MLSGGCTANSEKQAIITFTQQVLEIENKRAELLNWYEKIDVTGNLLTFIVGETFLTGVKPDTYYKEVTPPTGIEGMTTLKQQITLLICPQSVQSIKDSLVSIYDSEIDIGAPYIARDLSRTDSRYTIIAMDNLDLWAKRLSEVAPDAKSYFPPGEPSYYHNIIVSDWYKTQSFRRDVYSQWSQLLKQHGIDPAKEGFDNLVFE